ncbi:MAG: hydroxymethylbilane synthase [Deltaproteobacteria bacterium]|nr:MAG: hydroxymethylbilane synthase [Deltaproteobacteria bacterium]
MIRIGTRKSKLAMWQTEFVAARLEQYGLKTVISGMETRGDKILDTSIAKIGSKGVFTEELEEQLASGRIDIAVHSAKDLQSILPDDFELIAFTEREMVNDVLISHKPEISLDNPEKPLIIGTSSVRRTALLKHYYPQAKTVDMRGNLQTRIKKMTDGTCDALMLAYAGVKRMGYDQMIIKTFPIADFIPPVGQGCIGVEASARLDPAKKEAIRAAVNNQDSEICLLAERAFLRKLEGGCSIPAFGYAVRQGDEINLACGLASLDGGRIIKKTVIGKAAEAAKIGEEAARQVLQDGGREILAEIKRQQAAD